jgi:hypothetical protein
MAKVCGDLSFLKPFDLVSTGYRIPGSGIQFKDLFRTELLNGLDQADVDSFGIGIFPDLRLPVLPPGKAFFQFIGTAPEHDNPVAGKQVGKMPFDKSIHGNKFRCPAIDIDNPGVTILVITDTIRPDRSGKMDHGMSPPGKLTANQ